MKLNRIALTAALAVCLTLGASAFVPVAYGCSGGQPGSCREGSEATTVDMTMLWFSTGRMIAGMFG